MKVLICDDVEVKVQTIKECLSRFSITDCKWVIYKNDVINEVRAGQYDLLILDMTLPISKNSDIMRLGGKDILFELCLLEIFIPVIVITQYSDFSPDSRWHSQPVKWFVKDYINKLYLNDDVDFLDEIIEDDLYSIQGLHKYLCTHYWNYAGLVYMDEAKNDWKRGLRTIINYIVRHNSYNE